MNSRTFSFGYLRGVYSRYIMGAVRNAQLTPVVFPGWRLRIYIEKANSTGGTRYPAVPTRILRTLRRLGVQLVQVDAHVLSTPPMMWRFLVVDDSTVDYFIVRDVDSR